MVNNCIPEGRWVPADGFTLENTAMQALKSKNNTLIVAGPGAGKTELLAQKACYLLETNMCKNPKNILAISFKKDAAKNLKDRVDERAWKELSMRFESKTYDAFAKELLDRFLNSLPVEYRPDKHYEIVSNGDIREAFTIAGLNFSRSNTEFDSIFGKGLTSKALPLDESTEEIYTKVWEILLKGNPSGGFKPKLSYQMISRLTEFLLRENKYIRRAISMTYSHVFLDEFQDTTEIQYELVKTCFMDSNSEITAVGDGKQRIMLWAGALPSIFDDYSRDFRSVRYDLLMNHRSAPRLVEIQKMMYNSLYEADLKIKTSDSWDKNSGEAYIHIFENHNIEADQISLEIEKLHSEGVELNQICILMKQQVNEYGEQLIECLKEKGITARNEADFQDLLKEDVIKILVSIFKLAAYERAPDDWIYLNYVMSYLYGFEETGDIEKIREQQDMINELIVIIDKNFNSSTKEGFIYLVNDLLSKIGISRIRSLYPQYKNKKYYDDLIKDFTTYIWKEYVETEDLGLALENFEGKHSIPIMTIHKSKGLEFDTVFFVGVEDGAFWTFEKEPDENRCIFFVALSRAKRRIDFTFSKHRPVGYRHWQSREVIVEFYELLNNSGMVEEKIYKE